MPETRSTGQEIQSENPETWFFARRPGSSG